MSLTEQLIELIENKSIDDEDIEVASWFLLDAIANITAGRNTEQGRVLRRWFLEESPDTSRKVLFMGALMHILEMDDLHRRSVVHPGCVVIPAVLAVGLQVARTVRFHGLPATRSLSTGRPTSSAATYLLALRTS